MRALRSSSSDGMYNMGWDFFWLHHVRVVGDVVVAHHRGGRGDALLALDLLGAGVVIAFVSLFPVVSVGFFRGLPLGLGVWTGAIAGTVGSPDPLDFALAFAFDFATGRFSCSSKRPRRPGLSGSSIGSLP